MNQGLKTADLANPLQSDRTDLGDTFVVGPVARSLEVDNDERGALEIDVEDVFFGKIPVTVLALDEARVIGEKSTEKEATELAIATTAVEHDVEKLTRTGCAAVLGEKLMQSSAHALWFRRSVALLASGQPESGALRARQQPRGDRAQILFERLP